jgi:uncharacterized protein YcgL (UPF0745 family)
LVSLSGTYFHPIAASDWNACVKEAMAWIKRKNDDKKFPFVVTPQGFYLQLHKHNSMLLSYNLEQKVTYENNQ